MQSVFFKEMHPQSPPSAISLQAFGLRTGFPERGLVREGHWGLTERGLVKRPLGSHREQLCHWGLTERRLVREHCGLTERGLVREHWGLTERGLVREGHRGLTERGLIRLKMPVGHG